MKKKNLLIDGTLPAMNNCGCQKPPNKVLKSENPYFEGSHNYLLDSNHCKGVSLLCT